MDRASGWGSLQARAGRSPGGALEQPSADGWGWRFLASERDFLVVGRMPSDVERFRGSQDVGRRIAAHDLANRGRVAGTSVFPCLDEAGEGTGIGDWSGSWRWAMSKRMRFLNANRDARCRGSML